MFSLCLFIEFWTPIYVYSLLFIDVFMFILFISFKLLVQFSFYSYPIKKVHSSLKVIRHSDLW